MLPTGPICGNCRRYLAYHPAACPECLELRPLAYPSLSSYGTLVCAGCAEEESLFACTGCGREDHPYGHTRCARCILTERLTVLLTDPATGHIHDRLQPVFDTLVNSERPQTTIYWLSRPPGCGPALLRQMATGQLEVSHDTFTRLPMDRSRNYLRDLLAALGVLPPYEPRIERITPWLAELTNELSEIHRHTANQFARWVVLRRLRARAGRDELTKGMVQTARHNLKQTVTLLTRLDDAGVTVTDIRQSFVDAYLDGLPRHTATALHPFGRWLNRTGINTHIRVDYLAPSTAQVAMSDTDRWRHVHTLLHDDAIRRYTRIAGLFMLLFAQPVTGICRMRSNQVDTTSPDRVLVIFEHTPVEMPEPLGQLLRDQLASRGHASYASRENGWLFPGGIPGRHLATENVRAGLVALGIRPHTARHAAMFDLAAQVPHMILAQTLGISQTAATNWAALAARDWGNYIAARDE